MKTGKTETKHTPTDWKVAVADDCFVLFPNSDGSNKFNAHLIAAAPELLASLKLALEEGKFLPSIKDAFERTIAKAEGR